MTAQMTIEEALQEARGALHEAEQKLMHVAADLADLYHSQAAMHVIAETAQEGAELEEEIESIKRDIAFLEAGDWQPPAPPAKPNYTWIEEEKLDRLRRLFANHLCGGM